MFVITGICYTGVLFHTFHCNFYQAEKIWFVIPGTLFYRESLYRGLYYIGVRYTWDYRIGVCCTVDFVIYRVFQKIVPIFLLLKLQKSASEVTLLSALAKETHATSKSVSIM